MSMEPVLATASVELAELSSAAIKLPDEIRVQVDKR
jgi:hypothetical protein